MPIIYLVGAGFVVGARDGGSDLFPPRPEEAVKDGKPRFVDTISVELNSETTAIHQIPPPGPGARRCC
jgi:hypothetical protein